jgi:membrane-associated protease RseP (regulator of RpoE activity)
VGFAYWQGAGQSAMAPASAPVVGAGAPLERRLGELETSVALERFERRALAQELAELRELITNAGTLSSTASAGPRERVAAERPADESNAAAAERARQRFPNGSPQTAEERAQYLSQRQFENYVEAGLAPDRARYIMQRQEALEWEALQARYQATQSGAAPQAIAELNPDSLLRTELGEADYEKYLAGSGRPTRIRVNEVLQNSPAQAVGLMPGDEIVAYDGRRVFDIGELTTLTNELKPGRTVALAIERDGQPMQVFVESGPIGISGGGRSTRRER